MLNCLFSHYGSERWRGWEKWKLRRSEKLVRFMSRTVWKPFMPFTIQILLPNLAQPKSSFRGFSELIGCRDRFTLHFDVYRIENCVLWIRNEVVSRFLGCLSINSTHKIISNLKIVDVTHKWQITDPIFIYWKPPFVCVSSGIDIMLLLFDVIASIRERRSQAYPSLSLSPALIKSSWLWIFYAAR